MLKIKIALPEVTREEFAAAAQQVLNAAAQINADWYLNQWRRRDELRKVGDKRAALKFDPACCAKCAGVKYVPDRAMTEEVVVDTTPQLFAKRQGSCQSIAATHAGHKIAEAVYNGMPWTEACSRYLVAMAPGDDPSKPRLLHAVCLDDGELVDPTEGMVR